MDQSAELASFRVEDANLYAEGQVFLDAWSPQMHEVGLADPGLREAWAGVLARWAGLCGQPLAPLAVLDWCSSIERAVRRLADLHPEGAAVAAKAVAEAFPAASCGTVLAQWSHAVVETVRCQVMPALRAAEIANVNAKAIGHPALRLVVLVALGRLLVLEGAVTEAATVLLEGANLARKLGARPEEARLLGNLGFLYGEEDGEAYAAYTERALAIAREIGDERLIIHSLCNLGGAYMMLRRYDDARRCYAEGQPWASRLGWADSVALFDAGHGALFAAVGELDQARTCYLRSIRHFQSKGDAFQVARQQLILGRTLRRAGFLAEAFRYLSAAEDICRSDGSRSTAWQVHDERALVLEEMGDAAGALRALRASVQVREALLEKRASERVRLLEFHMQAERATRDATEAARRSAELQRLLEQQRAHNAEVQRLVRTDALTSLYNRRYLVEIASEAFTLARNGGRTLCIALLDVDHFKQVNDGHGHAVGDEVLIEVGRRLAGAVRGADTVARWGGEEFAVLLPGASLLDGLGVVQRMLERLRESPIVTRDGPLRVTASAGVAQWKEADEDLDGLLHRADLALYAAKHAGRNRVVPAWGDGVHSLLARSGEGA